MKRPSYSNHCLISNVGMNEKLFGGFKHSMNIVHLGAMLSKVQNNLGHFPYEYTCCLGSQILQHFKIMGHFTLARLGLNSENPELSLSRV